MTAAANGVALYNSHAARKDQACWRDAEGLMKFDLFRQLLRAKDLASSSFEPMAVFVLAALLYFVMSYPLSRGVRWMEARLGRGR